MDYLEFVNKKVFKKSKKPFKSGDKTATVKGVEMNKHSGNLAFSFYEDDSLVDCRICRLLNAG